MIVHAETLVVGGGPAGAAAAAELAGRGRRVVLAEAAPGPRDRVCGEFVSGESLPLLRRLDALGSIGEVGPVALHRARFTAPRGGSIELELQELAGGGPTLGLSRRVLDDLLLRCAEARGARLMRGARLRALLRSTDGAVSGAWLEIRGKRIRVKASLVIGADGRRSTVAHHARLNLPPRPPFRCAIKAHFHPGAGMRSLRELVEVHLFSGGYVGMQPVEGNRVNVSAVIDASLARRIGGGAARILLGAISASPAARRRLEGACPAGRAVSLYPLDPRRSASLADGVLLAGDAARVVPPFAGEGITAALHSGILAAQTADEALARGDLSAASMAGPVKQRGQRLRRARRMSRLLEPLMYQPALAGSLMSLLQVVPGAPELLLRSTRLA